MTRSNLHLASNLSLPADATTETFAILARKDGGKTYCGLKLFEEMHAAGAQCVAIDPVGKWWALRLAADGKSPGIDLPIFGGLYADLPLEPTAGAFIAQVIVDRGISAVIDVSLFEDRDMKRFVTDFARELYRLKQRNQSVLHVFFEEASTFLPQDKEDGADPPMLSAMKKIVRKGRNYGIGSTMIDQRAQDVNKKVLNQASILIVLGTSGSTDRKAIETWIRDKHIDVSGLDELASLEQGEAFVWLPREKTFKRVHVGKRWTFDASATPKLGAKRVERKLAPADVTALRDAMAESVERAEAEDPKVLRKKIVELEREITKARADAKESVSNALRAGRPAKVVEKSVVKTEQIARLERTAQHLSNVAIDVKKHAEALVSAIEKTKAPVIVPAPTDMRALQREIAEAADRRIYARQRRGNTNGLSKCGRALLVALSQRDNLTRPQLATLSGYSISSSSFSNGVSEINAGGYIAKEGDRIAITNAGIAAVEESGDRPAPPRTAAELRELWRSKLSKAAQSMMTALLSGRLMREELSTQTGYSITSSSFSNAISELNTNGLIRKDGPMLSLVEELM